MQQNPYTPLPQPSPRKKRHTARNVALAVGGAFAALIVIAVGASGGGPSTAPGAPVPNVAPPATTWSSDTSAPAQPAAAQPTETTPELPPQVQQAVASAQDYLGFKSFSHDGLIAQLSSQYADGYTTDVATQAVDSLDVDWNAQAVKSAQDYLSFQPFSCAGLIQQLDSKYGDQFTKAQATYGAHQTDACK